MTERWNPRWVLPAVAAAVATPLLVAAISQRDAGWHPVFDLAMTELRVRDVGGRHTPLIGLQGRIGPSGSHPGPLSFYLLAPVYRLLGASAFALQVATVVFHAAGALTALAVTARRRDGRLTLAVGVLLLLLVQGYGLSSLTEPWNPHLPVLWFVAFLVAIWGVVDGDLALVVPAVVAGSVCAQTHVPYLAVILALGAGATAIAGWQARRRRQRGDEPGWRWLVMAAGIGVVLWLPPLIDEVVHEPGNLSQLVDHLGTPVEEPIGVRASGELVLERLDAWQLVVGETVHPGTYTRVLSGPGPTRERGLLTAVVWLATAGLAAHLRHRRLLTLHGVVAAGVAVAVVTISRIYGVPWAYLMLWVFGIGSLMALAIVATLIVAVGPRAQRLGRVETAVALRLAGVAAVALLSVRLLVLAPDAATDTPDQTRQLGRLVAAAVPALEAGAGAATGEDGRYLVHWDDALHGGAEGIGLVNELVRRGFEVGVGARDGVKIGWHRVWDPPEATARIVLASGGWVERWSEEPGAVQIAYDDPRTTSERAEFERARASAAAGLARIGRGDLVARLDTDLFDLALNEGVADGVNLELGRMIDLGVPVAVFVLPPEGER